MSSNTTTSTTNPIIAITKVVPQKQNVENDKYENSKNTLKHSHDKLSLIHI